MISYWGFPTYILLFREAVETSQTASGQLLNAALWLVAGNASYQSACLLVLRVNDGSMHSLTLRVSAPRCKWSIPELCNFFFRPCKLSLLCTHLKLLGLGRDADHNNQGMNISDNIVLDKAIAALPWVQPSLKPFKGSQWLQMNLQLSGLFTHSPRPKSAAGRMHAALWTGRKKRGLDLFSFSIWF